MQVTLKKTFCKRYRSHIKRCLKMKSLMSNRFCLDNQLNLQWTHKCQNKKSRNNLLNKNRRRLKSLVQNQNEKSKKGRKSSVLSAKNWLIHLGIISYAIKMTAFIKTTSTDVWNQPVRHFIFDSPTCNITSISIIQSYLGTVALKI